MPLNIPVKQNKKLEAVVQRIDEHVTLNTYWYCSNITAIDRMGINDHGPVHIRIVANLALKLLRMLIEAGVQPSVEKDHKLTKDDAEVIVVLAAALHDIGHIVHRVNHEPFSVALAATLLPDLLKDIYAERERAIITSEVLHAIYAHETHIEPLTVEAGVLKIADALDMEEGRARIPFKAGSLTIHAVSASAIEDVQLRKGEKRPICIEIKMANSAGIFQIDNLLKEKLKHSGLSEYFEIRAEIAGEEKKLVERYEL
ncbi:MAG: HD domain-containing protein [Candidatus Bipolaricaulota bacterium]|nr:HD domain-containing protein [Candidatus Bipolaricaulota bacterium]